MYKVGNKIIKSGKNPLLYGGLRLAYDISYKCSLNNGIISNGDNITTVNDLSGNGLNLTIASSIADYKSNGYNGNPCLSFSAAAHSTNIFVNGFSSYTPYHVFLVFKPNTSITSAFSGNQSGGGNQMWWVANGGITRAFTSGASNALSGQISNSVPNILRISYYDSDTALFSINSSYYFNASPLVYRIPTVSNGFRLYVGNYQGGTYFDGEIYAVYVYDSTISNIDLNSIHSFLKNKYL